MRKIKSILNNFAYFVIILIILPHYSKEFVQEEFYLFPNLPLGVPKSDNPVCREQSELFVDNLKNLTLWAHEIWDSTAKATTGILRGNIFQMGHFEQCTTTKAPFETQYCLATITLNVPKLEKSNRDQLALNFDPYDSVIDRLYKYRDKTKQERNMINIGWCVPASCTIQDLEISLNNYLDIVDIPLRNRKNVTYKANIIKEFCAKASDKEFYSAADYLFGLLTLILVLFVLISTGYEYKMLKSEYEKIVKKKGIIEQIVLSFSAKTNFNEMSHVETSNKDLNILYGLRTISILIIILDHRFGTFTSSALINFDYVERQYRSAAASIMFHGDLFVDTFFILSGVLVTYGLLSQFDKKMINPAFIILMRYIRLTPMYAYVIFYYATVFNYIGKGPLWKIVAGADSEDCKKNWWTNLLYVNNYVNADHMCMTHAWYLPADFHYFIIAIGICILIHKNKNSGISALVFFTILSMIIPLVITVIYTRPPMLMFYPDFLKNPKSHIDFLLTYSKSHTRAAPYFIGMFSGFIYYRMKGKNHHICRKKSAIYVFLSFGLIAASIFLGAVFFDPYHSYNLYEAGFYAGFHRALWSLGSIGLMYVASFGHGGIITKFLCWKPWIPLSKLQFGAYLIHMQFQLRSAASFMNPRYITYFDLISLSVSDMGLAFLSALGLYLAIEAPFRRIFKTLLMPKKEPKETDAVNNVPINNLDAIDENHFENVVNKDNSHHEARFENSRL